MKEPDSDEGIVRGKTKAGTGTGREQPVTSEAQGTDSPHGDPRAVTNQLSTSTRLSKPQLSRQLSKVFAAGDPRWRSTQTQLASFREHVEVTTEL